MELNFGDWQGMTWAKLRNTATPAPWKPRPTRWGFASDGESYAMLTSA